MFQEYIVDKIREKMMRPELPSTMAGKFIFFKNRLDYNYGLDMITGSEYFLRLFPNYAWVSYLG